jgi:hypothetical protein
MMRREMTKAIGRIEFHIGTWLYNSVLYLRQWLGGEEWSTRCTGVRSKGSI